MKKRYKILALFLILSLVFAVAVVPTAAASVQTPDFAIMTNPTLGTDAPETGGDGTEGDLAPEDPESTDSTDSSTDTEPSEPTIDWGSIIGDAVSAVFLPFTASLETLAGWIGDSVKEYTESLEEGQTPTLQGWQTYSMGSGIFGFLGNIGNWWDQFKSSLGSEGLKSTVEDGGMMFVNDRLNETINKIYEILYPFGFLVMLGCWIFSVTKTGISLPADLRTENSIVRVLLGLVLGVFSLSLAPYLMQAGVNVGFGICNSITQGITFLSGEEWIQQNLTGGEIGYTLITLVLQCVLLLNILRLALLQCLSPVWVGFMAGGKGTSRFVMNFAKEYAKCCLIPLITTVYVYLCAGVFSAVINPIFSLVIGFSIFGIAGKKLDKLLG